MWHLCTMEYYFTFKNHEIVPFASNTPKDCQTEQLSQTEKEKQPMAYKGNLKLKDTTELTHKIEMDSQPQRTNLELP